MVFTFDELPDKYVTPLAGVWIEIVKGRASALLQLVTPLAGVWIEIIIQYSNRSSNGHSPRGSVD